MKAVTENIPQIFYDIIARIIPGAVLLWSAYIVFSCAGDISELPAKALAVKNLSFVESVQVLLLSYIVSIILSGVYMFIREKKVNFTGRDKDNGNMNGKENGKKAPSAAPDDIIWRRDASNILEDIKIAATPLHVYIKKGEIKYPSNMIIYDYLRALRPEIGGRLVKLRAECHMYAVLAIGWSILFLINLVNIIITPTSGALATEAALLLATAGISITLAFQENRYNHSLKSHWILLKSGILDK